jgi:hypothetical protein
LNHPIKRSVEGIWSVNEIINVARLVPRSSVDEKMQRSISVWSDCVNKVVAPTEITQGILIRPQAVRNRIPADAIQIGNGNP